MTMTTRPTTTLDVAATPEGELQAELAEMIASGKTDMDILRATKVPIATIRAIRRELEPKRAAAPEALVVRSGPAGAGPDAKPGSGRRADRRFCADCGAVQSEHVKGEGMCARTFCRAFKPADEEG